MDAIFRRGIDPPCRAPSSLSAVEQLRAPAADSGELEPGYRHGREVRRDVRAPQVAVERDRLGTQARALLDPGCAVVAEQDFARVRIDPVVFDDLGFLAGKPGLSLGLGLEGVVSGADHAVRAGIAAGSGPREDGGWRRNGGGGPYRSASCTSARRTSARARSSLAAWNEWTDEGGTRGAGAALTVGHRARARGEPLHEQEVAWRHGMSGQSRASGRECGLMPSLPAAQYRPTPLLGLSSEVAHGHQW